MTDVEASEARPLVDNPFNQVEGPPMLPARHPLNILKRGSYIGLSLYGWHYFEVYHNILHSPKISHEWFKIFLTATIGALAVKAYVEIFGGKLQKRTVNYKNFKHETHATIVFIILCGFSFHAALWPVYGAKSFLIAWLGFFGVVLQITLLIPTYVQNIAGVIFLTFFLQQYQ